MAAFAWALLLCACHGGSGRPGGLSGNAGCRLADSLLAHAGLAGELHLSGTTTIDVNQYRVRGRFDLTASADDNVVLSFTSTSPMGGRREDVVVSLYEDTLRIFDRERAELHVGAEIDTMVEEEAGIAIDLARLIPLLLARMPECSRVSEVRAATDAQELTGRIDRARFEMTFDGGFLRKARFPLPLAGGASGERVEVDYTRDATGIRRVVALMPERRWRVRLECE